MFSLAGDDLARVSEIVGSAFTLRSLETFLKTDLRLDLEDVVGDGKKRDKIIELIDWFQREGRLPEFLEAVTKSKPKRQDIKVIIGQVLGGQAALTVTPPSEPLIGRTKLLSEIEDELRRPPVRPILLWGRRGVGKRAIIGELYKRARDGETPLGRVFKTVVYWDRTDTEAYPSAKTKAYPSPLTGLFGKLFAELGHPESGNSKLDGQLHSLELELQKRPTLVLIDLADSMLSRMRLDEQNMLYGLWKNFGILACFVVTAEKQLRSKGVSWGLQREVGPLSSDDAKKVFRRLLANAGYTGALESADEAQIVEHAQCSPGLMEQAADLLGGPQPLRPVAVLAALAERSDRQMERPGGEMSASAPSDFLAAALTLVPSRRWSVVEEITGDSVQDFAAAQASLFDRFSELGPRDAPLASELLPDGLTSRAKEFLSHSGPEAQSLHRGMRRWVSRVMKDNRDWQRDYQQYEMMKASIGDLRFAVKTLLKEELAPAPGADEISTWIEIAETVHDFGSWDMAAGMMAILSSRLANLSDRLEVQLKVQVLIARHLSYRGETERAIKLLDAIESEAGERFPDIVVHARLRKGQSRRFSDQSQARTDLLFAMERGNVHDYLVATGFLVDVYLNPPQGDRGELLLDTALGMHQVLDFPAERIRAHHLRLKGEIRLIAGNFEGARAYFEQASDLGRQWTNDQRLLGWCQLGLGLCNASRKNAEAAELAFRQLELDRDQKRAQRLISYLDRIGKGRAPCVFILGGPAAGKTTLREGLAEWLLREGIPAARTGIEEAQRVCFPPPGPPAGNSKYEYRENGSLELKDRDRQIPVAYNRLRGMVRDLRNHERRAVIIEFTHPQLQWAFEELGTDLLEKAVVFYLDAPWKVRVERNRQRLNSPSHVDDYVVKNFDGTMDDKLRDFLRNKGATVQWIDATVEPDQVFARGRDEVEKAGLYCDAAGAAPKSPTGG